MKEKFNKILNTSIFVSILLIIFGIILIAYPTISLRTLEVIIALYLLANGIVTLVFEMTSLKLFSPFENTVGAVIMIVLGIVLLGMPGIASVVLTLALGVWIITQSMNNIKVALFFKDVKNFPSKGLLFLGILDIILGFLVIFNPFEAALSFTLFIGIMLVTHAIVNIINVVTLKKNIKSKKEIFEGKVNAVLDKVGVKTDK